MLLSRKRGRELLAASEPPMPALRHHHIDEKWFLRDLLDANGPGAARSRQPHDDEQRRARAQHQVVEFLHRHNRIPPHAAVPVVGSDAHDNSLQMSRARMSSQELFLSVVLEWQRAEVDADDAQPHERQEQQRYSACGHGGADDANAATRRSHTTTTGRSSSGYHSSAQSDASESSSESASASSDSEMEEIHVIHRKQQQRQLAGIEEISPTSVHNVPRQLTPLHLDFIVSPSTKRIGIYSPRSRQELLRKYMVKRAKRLSQNKVRYRVRKTLANARPRVKGRFVKTEQPLTAALVESMAVPPSQP